MFKKIPRILINELAGVKENLLGKTACTVHYNNEKKLAAGDLFRPELEAEMLTCVKTQAKIYG